MYEILIVWFFAIVLCSLANILLIKLRKPTARAVEAKSADCEADCVDFEDENIDDVPGVEAQPKSYPQTGKVIMLAENLARALDIVKDCVPDKYTTLPIVRKVLIEFREGIATFTTTNLETAIVTNTGCKIESEFTCVLPFKILHEVSKVLHDDIVKITKNGPIVTFQCANQTVNLIDDDPQDYPPLPKVEGESTVISELAESIKKVKDKLIPLDSKHWNCGKFAGLFFDLSKPNIVATDGNRMKIATLECEPKPMQFRISKDAALTLARFKEMDCRVTSSENATSFLFGEYVGMGMARPWDGRYLVITQNLKGTYPDYEALKESHKEAVSVL
jgi:DNA polymerase III sliding clamp (beta) subunit (PCNA family)